MTRSRKHVVPPPLLEVSDHQLFPSDSPVHGILRHSANQNALQLSSSSRSPHLRVRIQRDIQIQDSIRVVERALWRRIEATHQVVEQLPSASRGAVRVFQHSTMPEMVVMKTVSLTQLHLLGARQQQEAFIALATVHGGLNDLITSPSDWLKAYTSISHHNLATVMGVLSQREEDANCSTPGGHWPVLSESDHATIEDENGSSAPIVYLVMRQYVPHSSPVSAAAFSLPVGRSRLDVLAHLMWQVVASVCCFHRQQLVHGNIKPSNVLIADDHHVCLTDAGLPILPEAFTELSSHLFLVRAPAEDSGWLQGTYLRIKDGNREPASSELHDILPFIAPECLLEVKNNGVYEKYIDFSRMTAASDGFAVGVLFYRLHYSVYPTSPPLPLAAPLSSDLRKVSHLLRDPRGSVFSSPPLLDPQQANSVVPHSFRSFSCVNSSRSPLLDEDDAQLSELLTQLLHPDPSQRLSLLAARSTPFFCSYGPQRHELLAIKRRGRVEWDARRLKHSSNNVG